MTNYKDKGWTPIPNIVLNNPGIPRCVRGTYEAISARAFGKKFSVLASIETIAKDVGVSTRTIDRHLAVLEALKLIKRVRNGRGITNTIILTLKIRLMDTDNLARAIDLELLGLSGYVLKRKKLTMRDALKLVSKRRKQHREVSIIIQQAQEVVRQYRRQEAER